MTDEPALIAAICAVPEDDTRRLVYADWLEENAQEVECGQCGGNGHSQEECDVCGNTPDESGRIEHGRGCYKLNDDGGGSEPADDCPTCSGSGRIPDGRRERAEFIKVQVELARWGGCEWKTKHRNKAGYINCDEWNNLLGEGRVMTWCPACIQRKALRRRERELFPFNGFEHRLPFKHVLHCWADARKEPREPDCAVAVWSRGFVSHIICPWADWSRHADAITARQPVERCKFTTVPRWKLGNGTIHYGDRAMPFIQARWPRIVFELHEVDPARSPYPHLTDSPPMATGGQWPQ